VEQDTATRNTHCNPLENTTTQIWGQPSVERDTATHCNTHQSLQHTATHCNTDLGPAFRCTELGNTLQHATPTASQFNTRQRTATPCNTLQHRFRGSLPSSLLYLRVQQPHLRDHYNVSLPCHVAVPCNFAFPCDVLRNFVSLIRVSFAEYSLFYRARSLCNLSFPCTCPGPCIVSLYRLCLIVESHCTDIVSLQSLNIEILSNCRVSL